MKIKYLGTAAAEGMPAVLCNCAVCEKSRKLGGKNLRGRSQAIIDGDLLIDMPPETLTNLHRFNIKLSDISCWLITHTHSDHFYAQELEFTRNGTYAHYKDEWHGIDLYGSIDIKEMTDKFIWDEHHKKFVRAHFVKPFEPFYCGEYKITPLKANHGTDNPLIYAIEKGKKSILYAHDTGMFTDDTMAFLKNSGIVFDLISLDCTAGNKTEYHFPKHMCIGWNIECRERLIAEGIADNNTKFILNHFSHNGTDTVYDDFKPIAESLGFIASFDGMEIEV